MAEINPQFIHQSFDGFSINPKDYGDADVEVNYGGESSEVIKGKGGGADTVWKFDKIDTVTFTLRKSTSAAYKLENYHNQKKQIKDYICKDLNPSQQRTWTSTACNVKGFDALPLTSGGGFAVTLEFEEDLEIDSDTNL